jgi:putative transposase
VLRSYAGASRFAFNWGLALVKRRLDERLEGHDVDVPWSYHALCSAWAKAKQEAAPWRHEVVIGSFQAGFERLGAALQRFRNGRNIGRPVGFPRFRARGRSRDSVIFQYLEPADPRHVCVPKLGPVRSRESFRKLIRLLDRDAQARVLRATLYEERTGRWAISFTVERSPKLRRPRRSRAVVGVDVGLRRLATLSTGEQFENPRPLRAALRRIARLQRKIERQRRANNRGNYLQDGQIRPGRHQWHTSRRMRRSQDQLARLHGRVRNLRRTHAHCMTRQLTDEYGVIGMESLNIAGLIRLRSLSRSIADAGWGEIVRQLRYKTSWNGGLLVAGDRFFPSSKRCSRCGSVIAKLDPGATEFLCDRCGFALDRDQNAARNLAQVAFIAAKRDGVDRPYLARVGRERQNARGGQVRPSDWRCPSKREGSRPLASSQPGPARVRPSTPPGFSAV